MNLQDICEDKKMEDAGGSCQSAFSTGTDVAVFCDELIKDSKNDTDVWDWLARDDMME